jgi:hypothetical protein
MIADISMASECYCNLDVIKRVVNGQHVAFLAWAVREDKAILSHLHACIKVQFSPQWTSDN